MLLFNLLTINPKADVSTNNGYYPQKTRSAPDTPPAANGNHTVTNGNHRYDAYTVHTAGTKQVVVPRNPGNLRPSLLKCRLF